MALRLPGLQPRPWIFVWLLALVPVWTVGLYLSAVAVRWADQPGDVCNGLERYAALAGSLPEGPVGFLTDAPDPSGTERLFCAQLEAAPRPITRWRMDSLFLDHRKLPGSTLIVHFDDPAALQGFLRQLEAETLRQGGGILWSEPAPGVLVLRIVEG